MHTRDFFFPTLIQRYFDWCREPMIYVLHILFIYRINNLFDTVKNITTIIIGFVILRNSGSDFSTNVELFDATS